MSEQVRAWSGVSWSFSWRDYLEVCKPKVVALIVFTAIVGMVLAVPVWPPVGALVFGTLGIGLAASSAAAINHLLDQRIDAVMARTRGRPLPSGQLQVGQVLVEEGVAPSLRIEEPDPEDPLQRDDDQRDRHDRRCQQLHPGGGIDRPGEERNLEPAHVLGAHAMDGG